MGVYATNNRVARVCILAMLTTYRKLKGCLTVHGPLADDLFIYFYIHPGIRTVLLYLISK